MKQGHAWSVYKYVLFIFAKDLSSTIVKQDHAQMKSI